jgi:AraC family transcriptional regulator, regulatory protein of adaptative response / methylated-DNA-[protein]-cysteine methyltransferase
MEISMVDYRSASEDYRRIEQAILYLDQHYDQQPSLGDIAQSVHLSEYHFQKLFTRWVGISPKRFTQYLTKEHAKRLLEHSENLLSAAYESGLSGPGRLHDLFITWEAVTPGEYKRHGEGLEILYGFHTTPFGECLLALTERGVCSLIFVQNGDRKAAQSELERRWSSANLRQDQAATAGMIARMFAFYEDNRQDQVPLHVFGTAFQIKVWEALLRIPSGSVLSYSDISVQIGLPGASRAVGSAIGRNPIPILIPCHRVIRQTGEFGGYRWGGPRKKALLGWEMAKYDYLQSAGT